MTFFTRTTAGIRWSGPAIVGVLAVLVMTGVALTALIRVSTALVAPAADPETESAFDDMLAMHDDALETNRRRFDGRSAFFMPAPPPPPKPPPEPPRPPEPPPEPPKPPQPPAEYTGPKVIACIGGTVYFSDGMRLAIGEESSGVRVVATNPPYDVTLHHSTRDYKVPTIPDSTESFFGGSMASFGSASPRGMELVASSPSAAAAGTPTPPLVRHPDGRTLPAESAEGADGQGDQGNQGNPPPPPPQDPRPESPATSASSSGSSSDAPAPLTKEQIDQMDRPTASAAQVAVTKARLNRSIDEKTRARLNQEHAWLQARMRALAR